VQVAVGADSVEAALVVVDSVEVALAAVALAVADSAVVLQRLTLK